MAHNDSRHNANAMDNGAKVTAIKPGFFGRFYTAHKNA